jgi:hypothetical protein
MEARELVTRVDSGTGRLRDVGLTEYGAQEIGEAVRVHAAAVRTHFLGSLDERDKHALAALFRQLGLVGP